MIGCLINKYYNFQFSVLSTVLLFLCTLGVGQLHGQCSTNVYDTGGATGNYGNSENYTVTYTAPPGHTMQLSFNSFNLENFYDFLTVYDGSSTNDPLLASLTGNAIPSPILSSTPTITLKFVSDYSVTKSGWDISLSCLSVPDSCFAITKSSNGELYGWSKHGYSSHKGEIGLTDIAAMSLNYDSTEAYIVNAGDFKSIDLTTAAITSIGTVGYGDGPLGRITITDIYGMTINPTNGLILASLVYSGKDLLIAINPINGTLESNYFGDGIDYLELTGFETYIKDIAMHPSTYELYGVCSTTTGSSKDQIVIIDQNSGVCTPISQMPTCDIEGLSFNNNSDLYASTGILECSPFLDSSIYQIDYSTNFGSATHVVSLAHGDVESISCYVPSASPCVTVDSAGTISESQIICNGEPSQIINSSSPAYSINGGVIEYQWYKSTNSCSIPFNQDTSWVVIPGANSLTYNPGILTESTCFVRGAKRQGCSTFHKFSNVVELLSINCECSSVLKVDFQIDKSSDDAEEDAGGLVNISSDHLEIVDNGTSQTVGLKYDGINIPPNSNIVSAYLEFNASQSNSEVTNLVIKGQLDDNPSSFSSANFNLTNNRPRTVDSVLWDDVKPWTKGIKYYSPDISSLINEVIQNTNWQSGDGIALFLTGSGIRVADSYNKPGGIPVKLVVYYCVEDICDNNIDDNGDGVVECDDISCGFIKNREFNIGSSEWALTNQAANNSIFSIDNNYVLSGMNSAYIDITQSSGVETDIQFGQGGFSTTNATKYDVYFDAVGEVNRNIGVSIQLDKPPYTIYGYQSIAVTTTPNSYSFSFIADSTLNSEVELNFNLGASTDNIWIDKVQFKESCDFLTFYADVSDTCMMKGEVVTYEFEIYNNSVSSLSNISFIDTLLQGLTWNSEPYNVIGGVIDTSNINGNSIADFEILSIPIGVMSFQIDALVPINYNGPQPNYNQAFLDGLPASLNFNKASDYPGTVMINDKTPLNITNPIGNSGDYVLCAGETLSFSPSSGVSWISNNTSIATVNNLGFVTSLAPGTTTFEYTDIATGCIEETQSVLVSGYPTAEIVGSDYMCSGESSLLLATGGETYMWDTGETSDSMFLFIDTDSTFTVTVTNSYGCSDNVSKSIQIENCYGHTCFNGNYSTSATADWYFKYNPDPTLDKIVIRTTFSNNFVDNTYGANVIGWNWHTFSSLVASDHLVVALYDKNGTKQIEAKLDYLDVSPSAPSGYESLGVSGGDGAMIVGDSSDIIDTRTSLDVNFNDYGYFLTTDSPVTDEFYNPDPNYPNWIYDVWYEVEVKLSAFGTAGFGHIDINTLHASPAKLTNDVISVTEGDCCQMDVEIIGDTLFCPNVADTLVASYDQNITDLYIATDDTYLDESKPTRNFGRCSSLKVTGSSSINRPIIKFNIANIPSDAIIKSAVFRATKNSGINNTSVDIGVHRVTKDWVENNGKCSGSPIDPPNWNQNSSGSDWSSPGGDYIATPESITAVANDATYTWDVKSMVESWVDGTNPNYGFMMKLQNEAAGNGKYFNSSEYSGIEKPTLEIVYIKSTDPANVVLQWNDGLGNNANLVVTPTDTTTYIVSVVELGGCSGSDSIEVYVDPEINPSISSIDTVCTGSQITLTANGFGNNLTYLWSNGDTTPVTNVTVLEDTTFIVYVTTENGCIEEEMKTIIVSNPQVSIDFNNSVCLTDTSKLTALHSGGYGDHIYTWTGPNAFSDSTQTVDIIDDGVYNISIVDGFGCQSSNTGNVLEKYLPQILNLNDSVCEGDTIELSIDTLALLYQWGPNANNEIGSTVNVVPNPPSTTYNVTLTSFENCIEETSIDINVIPKTPISISGPNSVCETDTSQLSPSSGGTWISTNTSVASVSNSGLITSIAPGTATFIFTDTISGHYCMSDSSSIFTVLAKPILNITGSDTICESETTTLTPSTGGTWTSSNPLVATITDEGIVTGISAGTATFSFTSTIGTCTSDESLPITVLGKPIVNITGSDTICESETTTLTPSSGGTWTSSNPSIASVSDSGLVTGISAGTATFTFTNNVTTCSSDETLPITIIGKPIVSITGSDTICESETTTLTPSSGGTWTSSNPAIATVTDSGIVTGVSGGSVTFIFTNNITTCSSDATLPVTIIAKPIVNITGSDTICEFETTSLSPSTGGSWISNNPSIAGVTGGGLVIGVGAGTATFTFTNNITTCTSDATLPITVLGKPIVNITGSDTICESETTTLTPSSGGTWTSSNPSKASVTDSGLVTGLSAGTVTFTFTDSLTTCSSDATLPVTIIGKPIINITGSDTICEAETTMLSPSSGGTWTSSNPSIASVTDSGLVTGISAGIVTFTFTSTIGACTSDESLPITVLGKPIVNITGSDTICESETTTLTPSSGGTWTSSNPSIASVVDSGLVTGLSAGTVTFTFTNNITTCSSDATLPITILGKPIVNITGSDTICESETTTLTPSSGGTWTSSNPTIASVVDSGLVTGLSAGTVTFTFINNITTCSSDATLPVTIIGKPIVNITGSDTICESETTTLTPSSGGTWTSSNPSIASVTDSGLVTGISAGTTTFTFTSTIGACTSNESLPITVLGKPIVNITGSDTICELETTMLSPSSGGTWTSSNPSKASVTDSGLVTGISAGTVTFTFTDSLTTCSSDATLPVTIIGKPIINITGSDTICESETTMLSPNSGGTWTSSNPSIASVTDSGLVTGISAGIATFTFTSTIGACTSDESLPITVLGKPIVNITGSDTICESETTTLTPNSGGTWTSSNPSIASVVDSGLVTGLSAGTVTFTFTNNITTCSSDATLPVTILGKPIVNITGSDTICESETTTLTPSSGGTWTSSNPSIASVVDSGLVTGLSAGTVTFTFTNNITTCSSDATLPVTIIGKPIINITGSDTICESETTTLTPNSGGTWTSSNPSIASVTDSGLVTGISAGTTTFTFTSTIGTCTSDESLPITVLGKPIVNITGSDTICESETTTLTPSSGGTWTSSNSSIASVTDSGLVTGISAGTVTFTFTNNITTCSSDATLPVTIIGKPIINITGSDTICESETTTLTPSSGGTWTSSNPSIASVTDSGIVTGISVGTATFTFTSTIGVCTSDESLPITVLGKPIVNITGSDTICESETTTLTPNSGGTWTSSNPSIASVVDSGLVTGISAGTVTFTFTNSLTTCSSDATLPVTILGKPIVNITGSDTICESETTTLTPSSGGTWTSSNPSIASVVDSGLVTGLSAGTVTFTFINNITTCSSDATLPVTIIGKPIINITGSDTICESETTTLTPNSGGTWTSSNPSIASVTDSGLVTGISSGTTTFTFTSTIGTCISDESLPITVLGKPIVNITGSDTICESETTTLTPSSGGTWTSSNPSIASVVDSGLVTGLSAGTVTFTFTNNITTCSSDATLPVTIIGKPIINITGSDTICESETTTLTPSSGGTWTSSNPSIASVTDSGIVTGISVGTATFTFTSTIGACTSDESLTITVLGKPIVNITGSDTICESETTTLTPSSGGTWTSSNPSIASVVDSGLVTGISAGTVTFTFTNSLTTCSSDATLPVTIIGKPIINITGSDTICESETTTLTPNSGGTWTSSNPSIATVTDSGLVTGISAGIVTFTFSSTIGTCISDESLPVTVLGKPIVNITGSDTICESETTTLTPSTGGIWTSNNPSIASVTDSGVVTPLSAGTTTFIFTNSDNNCMSDSTLPITIIEIPIITNSEDTTLCIGDNTILSASSMGTWSSSDDNIAIISNSGIVTGLQGGNVAFTFLDTLSGCISEASDTITISEELTASIDFNGSICLEDTTKLFAIATGGAPGFTYQWSGPNGFLSSSETIDIFENGNYYLTITDANGCSDNSLAYVYSRYEPFITTLNTTICEGESINISVNSASAVAYQWGPNAANATTSSISVTPNPPSTTYNVTVTNDLGCETKASAIIDVTPRPIINLSGLDTLCIGEISQMQPSSGGTWVSTNSGVAVIDNNGQVTAISNGQAKFIFTDTITMCSSDTSVAIIVNPNPMITLNGPSVICIGDTTNLLPNTGGAWTSTDTLIATITNGGEIIGKSAGVTTFYFTNDFSGCSSDTSTSVEISPKPIINLIGQDSICINETTSFIPSNGGSWISSDTLIATIENNGVVTGISSGNVVFIYTNSTTGCQSDASIPLFVFGGSNPTLLASDSICVGENTYVSPTSGGVWTSSDDNIATITNNGTVSGINSGSVILTFTNSYSTCSVDLVDTITVSENLDLTISGDSSMCIGSPTLLNASILDGIWSSSNNSIATISSAGWVTPVSTGVVNIIYNDSSFLCYNPANFEIEIFDEPIVSITGLDIICEGETTNLNPANGGSWQSSDDSVAIVSNSGVVIGVGAGNATFIYTSTDGCSSAPTDTITVNPDLDLIIDFDGSICLEDTTKLEVIVSGGTEPFTYSWTGPSGFTSILSIIDVLESGNYFVTVTDSLGCYTSTSAFVYERYEPFIFALNSEICEGENVDLSVNSNTAVAYQWDANANNAVTNSVTVTPGPPSTTYVVTITNDIGCQTEASATINVITKPIINVTGPTTICEGEHTNLNPTSGGYWVSSNNSIAIIDDTGLVTGLNPGSVTFSFKDTSTGCWSDPSTTVTVESSTIVNITGDNNLCIGDSTVASISLTGGTWTSSAPSVATIDNNGKINTVSVGTANINYIPAGTDCYAISDFQVVVSNIPTINITGPMTICEGDNTTLSPTSGGIWTSIDTLVATISNSGLVTGIDGGSVFFSWVSNATGCSNTTNSPVSVVNKAPVSLTGPGDICAGEYTTLSPTSGGIWVSSNNAIASVSSNGIVLGESSGVAEFSFYESSNGCLSDETISVNVNIKPTLAFSGQTNICISDTTYITPSTNGTWVSDNPSVANITDQGMIIGLSGGNAKFTYTDTLTGCVSDQSLPLTVNSKPTTDLYGQSELCSGETITISPTSGGTWTSLDTDIATISNSGVITGVGVGATSFVFVLNSTGCHSDTTTDITVYDKPIVSYSGPSTVCEGTTSSLTPSSGGSWSSSNTNVATVTSSGVINGISSGTTQFTFTSFSTGCSNSPNQDFTVIGKPNIAITGPQNICIEGLTSLSPTNGGVWTSNDTSIATIMNDGTITGVGVGSATFIFTNSTTGCSSTNSSPIIVYAKPTVQITGVDEICIGSTTTLSPNSGGLWSSSNDAIATINTSGVVTGGSLGSAIFTFVENSTGCTSDASLPVTIVEKPIVSITGPTNICEGSTTTLSPSTGGNWTSNNPSVATVNAMGIVTGVSQGIAKFTFVSDEGCISDETAPVTIFGRPTIYNPGDDELCVGSSISLFPMNGGVWESTDTLIATIDSTGVINGIDEGNVKFVFTDSSTGCTSDTSNIFAVNELPQISILGLDSICIGNTTHLSPTTGGLWYSNDGSIATINNAGLVTGLAAGDVTFYFVNSIDNCQSENSLPINIKVKPTPTFVEGPQLCIGDTTFVDNLGSGTWESNNSTIATISNSRMIIGHNQGNVKFRFNSSGSCLSNWSANMSVNAAPNIGLSGPDKICIDGQTNIFPSNGGSWSSNDTSVASVINTGLVTGHSTGIINLEFQDSITGCISTNILTVEVDNPPTVNYDGDSIICIGFTTNLVSNKTGVWLSSDPRIASVSNVGIVTGHAPGKVTVSLIDSETGCFSGANSKVITVAKCLNHDFNVTVKNLEIFGNLSTNDNAILTTYNNNPTLKSKPPGSISSVSIGNDGTYTFIGDTPGKYIYEVEVCVAPASFGCPTTLLEITVSDNIYGLNNPINNLEFTSTYADADINIDGQQIFLDLIANDKCLNSLGCGIDTTKTIITKISSKGIESLSAAGIIDYTPLAGNIGEDTIKYSICNSDAVDRCDNSYLFITINADNANNSVVAPDDFVFTIGSTPVSDNVILNDSDPENDNLSVTPIGTSGSPVSILGGEYFIESNGDFTFTPTNGFIGPTEIVYTLCDDNIDQACTNATIHILVFGDMTVKSRVYLEGALLYNNNEESSEGKPLMRDNIRNHPIDGLNYIPIFDPYSNQVGGFDLSAHYVHLGPGEMNHNKNILLPGVLEVTGDNAIVDWIFMELRHKNDSTQIIATRSALVQRDGDIVDLDGIHEVTFDGIAIDSFYLVIKHRNHLGVMSMLVANDDFVDFTDPATPVFAFTDLNGLDYTGLSQKTVLGGYKALWSGDFDASGKVKFTNPDDDQNILLFEVLFHPDNTTFKSNFDLGYGYHQGDIDLDGKVKFTNPDDDKNLLFSQVLLFPLNLDLLANFDSFIQQVPE